MEWKKRERRKSRLLEFIDSITFGKIFILWIALMIVFGIAQFYLPFISSSHLETRHGDVTTDFVGLLNSMYFSFITATSTGFGDIVPIGGLAKALAAIEAIVSLLIYGIVISKLVGVKQQAILEEIYDINYEEAFTNYRRGLALVRTDIVLLLEKVEAGTIKPREIRDIWIVFSGLDQNLNKIRGFLIPSKTEAKYYKKPDIGKIELILSSMKLTMNKVLELIRDLKKHNIEWREELLLTSIHYDVSVIREICDYASRKYADRKMTEKLENLKKIVDEVEKETKEQNQNQESIV